MYVSVNYVTLSKNSKLLQFPKKKWDFIPTINS